MSDEYIILEGAIGVPAVGKNKFFGREDELRSLKEKLARGDSLYISAPRRIGKTSLMRQVEKDLKSEGNKCFFYSLEGKKTPSEWIRKLAIDNKDTLKNFLKNIDDIVAKYFLKQNLSTLDMLKGGVIDNSNWREIGEKIFSELYDSCPDGKRVVIFLDELAVMIQNMQEEQSLELRRTVAHKDAAIFMEWLRFIQQTFYDKLSFVIASSIGLPLLLKRLNLLANINHLADFRLDAWRPETAKECILALARGKAIEISPETAERMTQMIGWCSPYYVQIFFDIMYNHLIINKRDSCGIEDLSEIYNKLIHDKSIESKLNYMKGRLKKSLSKQEFNFACEILNKLAENDGVTAKSEVKRIKNKKVFKNNIDEEKIKNVLETLEHDGYIEETDGGYRFLSNLFRDWWRNEYGN